MAVLDGDRVSRVARFQGDILTPHVAVPTASDGSDGRWIPEGCAAIQLFRALNFAVGSPVPA